MRKSYPAIFTVREDGTSVTFPDFLGATEGETLEEAISNSKEFLDGTLAYYIDENIEIPAPSDLKKIQLEYNDELVSLIQGDPSRYIQKKTIRKNVTIPEWLAARGENDNVNFSELLTTALFKIYG